jgi:4,4'-diaponeurosporenoate glycosyltransferase
MYSAGLGELIEGWTKGFASGAGMLDSSGLYLVIAWISGAFTAVTGLTCSLIAKSRKPSISGFCLYAMYVIQFRKILNRLGNYGLLAPILFPVLISFFTIVFIRSAVSIHLTRLVRWRGRDIKPG